MCRQVEPITVVPSLKSKPILILLFFNVFQQLVKFHLSLLYFIHTNLMYTWIGIP